MLKVEEGESHVALLSFGEHFWNDGLFFSKTKLGLLERLDHLSPHYFSMPLRGTWWQLISDTVEIGHRSQVKVTTLGAKRVHRDYCCLGTNEYETTNKVFV